MDAKTAAYLRKMAEKQANLETQLTRVVQEHNELLKELENQPTSVEDELNKIPGRRTMHNLTARDTFTVAQLNQRANPLNFLVNQDGIFVMTHYPLVVWRPTAPGGATNLGRWRPVSSWPLAAQQVPDSSIDLSYEISDGDSQRFFQNEPAGPLFSRPDAHAPLPVPTMFSPNTTIQFFPTYEAINFEGGTPPTEGELAVTLPGYRIVNL